MRAHHVHVTYDFAKPVDRVFAYLSEHENLAEVFGAKVTRLRDGASSRNGVGSVRRLQIGPLPPFEETVTELVEDERVVYTITKGSPLNDHLGVMAFSERPGGGSTLDYRIRLGSAIPLLALVVKAGLTKSIKDAMPGVDERA
ncbi:MAG: SRPBCC family protein [Thermoleophilaceae bacterium]